MTHPCKLTRPAALAALGLADAATKHEITTAYRRLVKTTHPDRTGRTDPDAAARFTEITGAYRRLLPPTWAAQPAPSAPRVAQMWPPPARDAPAGPAAPPPSAPLLVAGPVVITPVSDTPRGRARRPT